MSDYNGWKNKVTWNINVFYMETVERMLKDGTTEEGIVHHIKRELNQDLYLEQRNLINFALELVDWDTLIARAKENVQKEQPAESLAE
jgi:hypothetical protein